MCSSYAIADFVKFSDVVWHTCNAQFTTEFAPFTARCIANGVSHGPAVALPEGLLHSAHVVWIPVVSNKTRDE